MTRIFLISGMIGLIVLVLMGDAESSRQRRVIATLMVNANRLEQADKGLKAASDQLMAADKQLKADNDQLMVADKQLKDANAGLQAAIDQVRTFCAGKGVVIH